MTDYSISRARRTCLTRARGAYEPCPRIRLSVLDGQTPEQRSGIDLQRMLGWLDDERSCLTRAGELMSLARVSPSVLDGQTPQQLDRVIDRWQRMLSGLDARTRFYFYLLRRPIHFPEVADGGGVSNVVTLGQRKRRAFLTERVQDVSGLYCVDAYDPGLSTVAAGRTGGPRWMAVREELDGAAQETPMRSVYLHSSIEAAAAALSADSRCKPGAGR